MIGKVPLPMVVAIEYENDIKTFQEELLKLALVRCPLKVGITYTAMDKTDAKNLKRGQDRIQKRLESIMATLANHTLEDPKTEYLILLGHEASETAPLWKFDWHELTFVSGQHIKDAVWKRIPDALSEST